MQQFEWNKEKNLWLQEKRGVNFNNIITALDEDRLLDIIKNPNKKYPKQILMIIEIKNYAYAAAYVKTKDKIFFKTIYPSRKYTKQYLKK